MTTEETKFLCELRKFLRGQHVRLMEVNQLDQYANGEEWEFWGDQIQLTMSTVEEELQQP